MNLNTDLIYKTVYNLCLKANTILPENIYSRIKDDLIMQNAYLAKKNNRPLCQDTGMVVVFVEIGQEVCLSGMLLKDAINLAVKDCYEKEFYRKSTVKDALFDRTNTGDNTPAIIYTDVVEGDMVKITLGVKGAGAENMSKIKMFNPTAKQDEIIDFIVNTALDAGENACPPFDIGVGIGGTMDYSCILAKKALFTEHPQTEFERQIINKIPNALRVSILTYSSHIASLPVCVNLNCHSSRHACAKIINGKIFYINNDYKVNKVKTCTSLQANIRKVSIKTLSSAYIGETVNFSGILYTARDIAHKKIVEAIKNNKRLPFDLKDAIIFYAGPAPAKGDEVIGPIGPTTSKRMDEYAPILYENGVLATIGKGERTTEGLYFTIKGGVPNVIQKCVKSCEIVGYPELGTEAIRKLYVENFPVTRRK